MASSVPKHAQTICATPTQGDEVHPEQLGSVQTRSCVRSLDIWRNCYSPRSGRPQAYPASTLDSARSRRYGLSPQSRAALTRCKAAATVASLTIWRWL